MTVCKVFYNYGSNPVSWRLWKSRRPGRIPIYSCPLSFKTAKLTKDSRKSDTSPRQISRPTTCTTRAWSPQKPSVRYSRIHLREPEQTCRKKKKMVMPADTSRSPTYQITVTITQMESKTKCWRKREFVSTWTSILIQTLPGITAARLNINRPLFYKVWPDIDGQSESEKIQQEDLLLKRGGGGAKFQLKSWIIG